ncbi:hypothetical protein AWB75_02496 [Caballeronia catudaia]|uniref:Secreted protein n=1 Tax=Caballeronia catudaia TaxID=1777136 RepID=A0A158AQM8_9BURK|nr:hypothetical protein [Caballeronia catudaia]SAK60055.1 hypothetical protein AWB75_02496 [Caballeronia catudaia]
MKYFNRLVHRECLILVAIAASAVTLQVREHVAGVESQPAQTSRVTDGRICEPSAADDGDAPRMLPADCGIRADMLPHHMRAIWV